MARTRYDGEDGLRALDERVAVASADVALAQRQLTRAERIAGPQQLAADAARRQFEGVTAPQIDAGAAVLDLAGALMTLELAGGDLEVARVRLARLLGREASGNLLVEDGAEPVDTSTPPDFATLIDHDPRVSPPRVPRWRLAALITTHGAWMASCSSAA